MRSPATFASILLSLSLSGCSSPQAQFDQGPPAVTGSPVRDDIAADLYGFKQKHAPKDKVLKSLGGEVTRVPNAAYLGELPHAEESVVTVPPETIAEWQREYALSAETYYVMAEDANDIILFFDRSGLLRDYAHL